MNEHRGGILEEIPVLEQGTACPEQRVFICGGYFHRESAAFDIRSDGVRQVVEVYQNIDNTTLAQQLDPVIQERPAVYLDKTLRYRIRDGAQAETEPGGKEQRAQRSALHGVIALIDFDQELCGAQRDVPDAPHLAGCR